MSTLNPGRFTIVSAADSLTLNASYKPASLQVTKPAPVYRRKVLGTSIVRVDDGIGDPTGLKLTGTEKDSDPVQLQAVIDRIEAIVNNAIEIIDLKLSRRLLLTGGTAYTPALETDEVWAVELSLDPSGISWERVV